MVSMQQQQQQQQQQPTRLTVSWPWGIMVWLLF